MSLKQTPSIESSSPVETQVRSSELNNLRNVNAPDEIGLATPSNAYGGKRKRGDCYEDSPTSLKRGDCSCENSLTSFKTEMREMLESFKQEQNEKFEKIFTAFAEVQNQSSGIKDSVDFLAKQYESITSQINDLEAERKKNLQYLQSLEDKLDNCERMSRSTCLELKNIPTVKGESKEALLHTVITAGNILKVPIQPHEVRDVFRVNSKDTTCKTVVVDLTSALLKERVIRMYRKSIRDNNRLTTEKLRLSGPAKVIFISENLSPKLKRLFFLTRDFAKSNDFTFCWTSNGKIFLRKREGVPIYL